MRIWPEHKHLNDPAERGRLAALNGLWIKDAAPDGRLSDVVGLVREFFGTPMAFVSLVDEDRLHLKAVVGTEGDTAPREKAFCDYTIRSDDVMVVRDASTDARFRDYPLVGAAPHIRFYAGAPLVTRDGFRIGALCIADTQPRAGMGERQKSMLRQFAGLVMKQIDQRRDAIISATALNFSNATELAFFSINAEGMIEFVNRAALDLFGYERSEMLGKPIDIIIPDRFRGAHHAGLARVLAGGATKLIGRTVEIAAKKRDDTEVPIEISLSMWKDERGVALGAIIRDISERRDRDARLLRLATQDTLTGLLNRVSFETLLADTLAADRCGAVILLDLDGFKDVNDSLGHAVGDSLLQAIAIRLPAVLPPEAAIARIAGDEFAILLPKAATETASEAVAEILRKAFETSFDVGGHVFLMQVSIGHAIAPLHGDDAEELLASADFALFSAKQSGGNRVVVFHHEMRSEAVARRTIQDELLAALQNGDLVLHYQPQVALDSGKVCGVESLIRWQHPERGMIMPAEFLPALEASSLALPVGWWVLDEACRQAAAWRAQGIPPIKMSVNLFAAQYRSGMLVQHVTETLADHDLPPSSLVIEVTETIALHNEDQAFAAMQKLRQLGVGIAFDDFGTGYASLSSLRRFPLTSLKIDRRFIGDLPSNGHDTAITRAMLTMGNDLGLDTVAEGIENEEQEIALRLLGCKIGQGYKYAAALAPDAAAAFLATHANDGHANVTLLGSVNR